MDLLLALAALILVVTGILHSYLGERLILIRLFRSGGVPPIGGSQRFTRRTLRFAWHLTSVAWFGFAALLVAVAVPVADPANVVLWVTSAVFGLHAVLIAVASRLRHFAWTLFGTAAGLTSWVALA